jgi:hypothetical protein
MSSSEEAFEKFRGWKKYKTVLKVTLANGGTPETFVGAIAVVDEVSWQVSFAVSADRCHRVVDFTRASFLVGKRTLEAERGEGCFLACVEMG